MHTGSCLCGQVTYQYDGEISELSRCYCHQCQKAQGGAFVAVAPIDAGRFTLTAGQACLKTFSASPGKLRAFCGECGSPLYSARDDLPEVIRLRVGTLDTPLAVSHQVHAFAAERPLWYEILDGFPQYPGKRPA